MIATFVQQLDIDYYEFINVLRGDLEADLHQVRAMKKLKRPHQEVSTEKLARQEKQVEDIVDLAEELAGQDAIGDYTLIVNYTDTLGDVFSRYE